MQSPPARAEATRVIILSPVFARPGRAAEVEVLPEELGQATAQGEGGGKDQPGIGHQAVVVKEDADTVGFVLWQHLLGAPCFRAGFCSKTIIPDSQEHPLASSRAVPKAVLRWIRANTPFQTKPDAPPARLIVRRVKPTPGSQLALFARYSYHAFISRPDGQPATDPTSPQSRATPVARVPCCVSSRHPTHRNSRIGP